MWQRVCDPHGLGRVGDDAIDACADPIGRGRVYELALRL